MVCRLAIIYVFKKQGTPLKKVSARLAIRNQCYGICIAVQRACATALGADIFAETAHYFFSACGDRFLKLFL
jgi:hypothetical protein